MSSSIEGKVKSNDVLHKSSDTYLNNASERFQVYLGIHRFVRGTASEHTTVTKCTTYRRQKGMENGRGSVQDHWQDRSRQAPPPSRSEMLLIRDKWTVGRRRRFRFNNSPMAKSHVTQMQVAASIRPIHHCPLQYRHGRFCPNSRLPRPGF